ncbi:DUF3752 domain-containing protein [Fusarium keratoplasticum]|uniref:DUF3752 domain-containing protein n=1 Tax=Fusarium keratoplasticum TaxID=1328300 RepID=A0ACC0RGU7_9HYPO|nr:DUF3752 domain-containing protein [Fusarium keratoplasticum]KAI8684710.1 DUF3752 domain-containing protein [Fusarium keratoplasticum]KAI8688821.1 DUF3752 domain-containing protein [Fusarium keratoplasticum]
MSSIGPQLPPHLSKRKRTPERDASPPSKHRRSESPAKNKDEIDLDDSDDDYGPSAPAPQKASIGPSLPPSNKDEIDLDSGSDSDTGPAPPKRTVGPAPPPADLSTRPDTGPDSDSDSEDDYGPALPGASNANKPTIGPQLPAAEPAPQRDSWMLAPPSASGYSERDPTKMRNRKFASKPASSSGPSTVSSIWTETPEEKLKRLQDSVLGRGDKTVETDPKAALAKDEEERNRKISANIEAQRGKSLYAEHQARREKDGEKAEEEDDPSKRGFDREKDMAIGGKIGTAQRRELMNKAANFGGRFQKGSYL